MMARVGLFVVAFSIFLLLAAPTSTSAEGFIDFYAGVASTQDTDVSLEEFSPFFVPARVSRSVDLGSSLTLGGRIGYWFGGTPSVGVALDVSSFQADGGNVDITLIPVSTLLMLRWPLLTSDDFPKGRLQPYVGIGPGLFISNFEADFRPAVAEEVSEWILDIGLDVRAGLAWQFYRHLALFGEYRFTYVELDFEQGGCLTFACALTPFASDATRRTAEATLNTHHFLMGVSFRF